MGEHLVPLPIVFYFFYWFSNVEWALLQMLSHTLGLSEFPPPHRLHRWTEEPTLVCNLPTVSIVLSHPFPLECDTALSVNKRATQLAEEDACHSQIAQRERV